MFKSEDVSSSFQERLKEDIVLPGENLGEERPAVGCLVAEDEDLLHNEGVKGVDGLQ